MRAASLLLLAARAGAGIFKPTSLLVVTHGNGALLNTASRPVLVHEVAPPYTSLASQLVRTISLPTVTSGSQLACTLYSSGTHANASYITPYVGHLSRSSDGRFAALGCLGCPVGSTLATASCPRVVARIDANGGVNTSTAILNWAVGAAPLSVATIDGQAYWLAGLGGVLYAPHGLRGNGVLLHALDKVALVYQVILYGGQLFGVTTFQSAIGGARVLVRSKLPAPNTHSSTPL